MALAAVAALVAAGGCGSSSKSGSSATTANSGSPTTASGSPGAASGTPLAVGSSGSLTSPIYTNPEDKAGLEAGVDAVNAAGGVDGHPLKLTFCDSHQQASAEVSCTESLISSHIVAALSPLVTADATGRIWQLYKAAGIAAVGTVGALPSELQGGTVFPMGSGLPGWNYGAAANLLASGAKHIGILVDTTPPSQFNGVLSTDALKSAGVTPTVVTGDPNSDPTFATAAAKVTGGGVDGLLLLTSPPNIPKAVTALKQVGYSGKISTLSGELVTQVVKAVGNGLNGMLISSLGAFPTDTSNSGVQAFRADMMKYQPGAGIDDDSLRTWSAVMLFAKVAGAAHATTASAVLAAFNNLSTPVDLGTYAPYKVVGSVPPLPAFPRMFNPTVTNGVFENGAVQPDGKGFVNPFTALTQHKG
jgi:branched-chain amino acid transport system substrate-binding protein